MVEALEALRGELGSRGAEVGACRLASTADARVELTFDAADESREDSSAVRS